MPCRESHTIGFIYSTCTNSLLSNLRLQSHILTYRNMSATSASNGHPVVPVKADEKPLYGDMRDYAAPSLFQGHRTRQAIRDAHEGKIRPLLTYYAALSSPVITRFVAPFGFDGIWIDWEHTSCNVETMTQMVRLPHDKHKQDY